ncbi:MAG: hypothetical protein B7Z79_05560 [Thiomonas sp. 20-64-9]|uniref:hypothetical protein n=1 Tax=unclassified Thiomonas TaxID=2625466 RepID=UPI000BCAACDB|nr:MULTISPECIES: hypothetical protein [unclassified Thiomonas]OYV30779.1 MAG: hypothetical protein B7Z79_05560 [Thiomonas sp. 20-64-9]OZB70242.1 MAG: hypothetical protein B7X30_09745 [Thiomonas sp. 13-64-67]
MPGAPKRDDVGAALVWAAVMRALHAKTPSRQNAKTPKRQNAKPPSRQQAPPSGLPRVGLTAASTADARWQGDGRPLGRGARLPWFPQPGRHQIALVDARGAGLRTRR